LINEPPSATVAVASTAKEAAKAIKELILQSEGEVLSILKGTNLDLTCSEGPLYM
jgi:hypothetical protein